MEKCCGLQIRGMQPADLDQVMTIERGSYGTPWSRNMFLDELSNKSARQLVFNRENRIIGYICFWQVMDESHVLNIAVHPDLRRRGHGKYIMDLLELTCQNEGLKRIILDVGRRNIAARSLYRKCGFKIVGFRKNYYTEIGDDALVMEKLLETSDIISSLSG